MLNANRIFQIQENADLSCRIQQLEQLTRDALNKAEQDRARYHELESQSHGQAALQLRSAQDEVGKLLAEQSHREQVITALRSDLTLAEREEATVHQALTETRKQFAEEQKRNCQLLADFQALQVTLTKETECKEKVEHLVKDHCTERAR